MAASRGIGVTARGVASSNGEKIWQAQWLLRAGIAIKAAYEKSYENKSKNGGKSAAEKQHVASLAIAEENRSGKWRQSAK
jgi:hypothetical protein